MLDTISRDLGVSEAAAGQVAGLFSLGICVTGPVLGALTSRYQRRSVLAASLVLMGLGHAAAALAPDFGSLLAVRVLTSAAASLFTPQAAATASLLVPLDRRARTMAYVFLGWSVAAVVGLPAGAWLGKQLGWRAVMWIITALAALATAWVLWRVPSGLFTGRIDASAWRELARHPVLLRVVSVTVLHATAQFALFSFIVVAFREALSAPAHLVTALLCLNGMAGFLGNIYAGRIADRIGPAPVIAGSIAAMFAGFVVWIGIFAAGPGSLGIALAVLAALLWGGGNFGANSMQQVRLVNHAPPLAAVSVALNTSAIYLGQFIGTALGGLVLTQHWSSPPSLALPWLGLPIFALAIAVSVSAQRREERAHPGAVRSS